MKEKTSCDCCLNYAYDEEYEGYECQLYLDEDEMGRFSRSSLGSCPYFKIDDEYKIVRKQM